MLNALFVISSCIQILVAYLVFKKGRPNLSYLLFFVLSIITWVWVFLNYLSLVFLDSTHLTLIIRLIMLAVVFQVGLFYLFAQKFPQATWHNSDIKIVRFGVYTCLTALVAVSPYMFKTISAEGGSTHAQIGAGIIVFIAYICWSVCSAFRVLLRKFRNAAGLLRSQILLILLAAVLNWIIIPITNFALTLTLKTLLFVMLSPLYGLAFSGIIAYALAKHHLFNNQTSLQDSVINLNYYLRQSGQRVLQYYMLQTLVYRAGSNHIALDFSGVEDLDQEAIALVKHLRQYMAKQGKKVYFIRFNNNVFKRLKPID